MTGALVGAAATTSATGQTSGKIKLTTLYGAPKNPEEFEKLYVETLIPMVAAIKGISRFEASKCLPQADGTAPAFYRIFEAWFDSAEQMKSVLTSAEWDKIKELAGKIATGGVTRVVSKLD